MSKIQERDTGSLDDFANTTIAGQLESRLKELERNLAVAREFIKMADECYSQVKHEWELLQHDTHIRRPAPRNATRSSVREESDEEDMPGEPLSSQGARTLPSRSTRGRQSGSTRTRSPPIGTSTPHSPSLGARPETGRETDTSRSNEKPPASHRGPESTRPGRKGKASPSKE